MQKKLLFTYVFLIAYSGAMLHSIVPHHHHDSLKKATEHHHHHENDGYQSHQHDQQDKNRHDDANPIYFLTHAANSDITIAHSSEQGTVKIKKSEKQVASSSLFIIFRKVPLNQIFDPPLDDIITDNSLYLFRTLRAPPVSVT